MNFPDQLCVLNTLQHYFDVKNDDFTTEEHFLIKIDSEQTNVYLTFNGFRNTINYWVFYWKFGKIPNKGTEIFRSLCRLACCINPHHHVIASKNTKLAKPWLEGDWKLLEWSILRRSVMKENGCREWTSCTERGYGLAGGNRSHILAYRAQHKLYELPQGMVIRHLCNNRSCVLPAHLKLGTPKENLGDQVVAGTISRGENKPTAKLTEEIARLVKFSKGECPAIDRARKYGVSKHTVSAIDRGMAWNWLGRTKEEDNPLTLSNQVLKKKRKREVDDFYFEDAQQFILNKVVCVVDEKYNHESPHWLFLQGRKGDYAQADFAGSTHQIHRLSYISFNKKELPSDLFVRHKCREKRCCNPAHLEEGTASDNQKDRQRDSTGVVGSQHPGTTLTEDQVRDIKRLKTDLTVKERASMFTVSQGIIRNIDSNRTWKHVT